MIISETVTLELEKKGINLTEENIKKINGYVSKINTQLDIYKEGLAILFKVNVSDFHLGTMDAIADILVQQLQEENIPAKKEMGGDFLNQDREIIFGDSYAVEKVQKNVI